MPDLVPVHGGLEAPVSRTVPLSRRKQFLAEAAALPRIEMIARRPVDGLSHRRRDAVAAHRPDGRGDLALRARSRRDRLRLPHTTPGRRRSPSRSPTTRPRSCASASAAAIVYRGQTSSPCCGCRASSTGTRPSTSSSFYGTARTDHPGGHMVMDDPRTQARRRRALGAAAAGRPGVRQVRALAAPDAHADRRAPLGARRRLPDPQPAAPRARVRAGLRRRAPHRARATTPASCSIR